MPRNGPTLAAIVAAALAGCLSVRTPEPGAPLRLAGDEGVVFGRLRAFDRGAPIDPWSIEPGEVWVEDPVIRLALLHVESGSKRPDVPVESGGRVAWILPEGTYLLYHTPSVDPPWNEPLAAFQVRAGPEAADLGELRLLLSVDRPLGAELATYSLVDVTSAPGTVESSRAFLDRHPGIASIRRCAWTVDPELRGLFADWSREACERVLARHGLRLLAPSRSVEPRGPGER